HHPGSFTDTNLNNLIDKTGRKKLVLAGYMAHVCVSTTARQAAEKGYDVILPREAIGDRDIPGAEASVLVDIVLSELADAFGTVLGISLVTSAYYLPFSSAKKSIPSCYCLLPSAYCSLSQNSDYAFFNDIAIDIKCSPPIFVLITFSGALSINTSCIRVQDSIVNQPYGRHYRHPQLWSFIVVLLSPSPSPPVSEAERSLPVPLRSCQKKLSDSLIK
ncbi:hypothetical protein I307_05439, partial [Cryptococcus deuterogattii 99/473]